MTADGYGVPFHENILKLDRVELCEYRKNHWIARLKRVNFIICEVRLGKTV